VLYEGAISSGTLTLSKSYKLYDRLDFVLFHNEPGQASDWCVNYTLNLRHLNGVFEAGYSVLMRLFGQIYVSLTRINDIQFTVISTAATINGVYGLKTY
jgi:hypothetical protein